MLLQELPESGPRRIVHQRIVARRIRPRAKDMRGLSDRCRFVRFSVGAYGRDPTLWIRTKEARSLGERVDRLAGKSRAHIDSYSVLFHAFAAK
jgi:hypothetical protein